MLARKKQIPISYVWSIRLRPDAYENWVARGPTTDRFVCAAGEAIGLDNQGIPVGERQVGLEFRQDAPRVCAGGEEYEICAEGQPHDAHGGRGCRGYCRHCRDQVAESMD